MTRRGWLSLTAIAGFAVLWLLLRSPSDEVPVEDTAPSPAVDSTDLSRPTPVFPLTAVEPEPAPFSPEFRKILREGLPTPGCSREAPEPSGPKDMKELQALNANAVAALSKSDDPELLLAAAIMAPTDSDVDRLRLLRNSLHRAPENPLAHWAYIQHCDAGDCDRDVAIERAIEADPLNAALWMEAARDAIRSGNWELAEQQLRQGLATNRFDTYWIEHTLLLERALAASSNFSFQDRAMVALGYTGAVALPSFKELTSACKSDANDDSAWISLCGDLGRMMHESGRTLIVSGIGLALQRIAAERDGNSAQLNEIRRQRESFSRDINGGYTHSGATALLINDVQVLKNYLDHASVHGELSAVRSVAQEARRLRADPTYDQCNFVIKSNEID